MVSVTAPTKLAPMPVMPALPSLSALDTAHVRIEATRSKEHETDIFQAALAAAGTGGATTTATTLVTSATGTVTTTATTGVSPFFYHQR